MTSHCPFTPGSLCPSFWCLRTEERENRETRGEKRQREERERPKRSATEREKAEASLEKPQVWEARRRVEQGLCAGASSPPVPAPLLACSPAKYCGRASRPKQGGGEVLAEGRPDAEGSVGVTHSRVPPSDQPAQGRSGATLSGRPPVAAACLPVRVSAKKKCLDNVAPSSTTGVFIKGFALWLHLAWWGSGAGIVQGARSPFIITKGQRPRGRDARPLS